MPRRTFTRKLTSTSSLPNSGLPSSESLPLSSILQLRRQWKWAAFSQFFFTFKPLFVSNEVTLADIERDLTRSTNVVLPRIMQRLLYTLTQDRKISPETWQTVLRKQYLKRGPKSSSSRPDPLPILAEPSLLFVPEINSHTATTEPISHKSRVSSTQSSASPASVFSSLPTTSQNAVDDDGYHSGMQTRGEAVPHPVDKLEDDEDYNWLDLPMLDKLDSIHLLTEWQFQNPMRLRSIMKDDDEEAQWRVEPIGYDAKGNAYWLIGADRLWIQRPLLNPRNLKRKRPLKPDRKNFLVAEGQTRFKGQSAKQQQISLEAKDPSSLFPRRIRERTDIGTGASRASRAAKTRASIKLDVQAKGSEFQKQADRSGKLERRRPRQPMGTRVSARLRADIAQEGWQLVPEEWLAGVNIAKGRHPQRESLDAREKALKTGLESDRDSISDLTELSSDDQNMNHTNAESNLIPTAPETTNPKDFRSPEDGSLREPDSPQADIVEWETICVTMDEWEHVAERFEKATHYSEKALHRVLVHDIVPVVTNMLKETERKQRLEEALVHRKRSSRIAIKESEKEEARVVAKKQAEGEEKMSRARRLEARLQREGAERERREMARDQRREKEAQEPVNQETRSHVDVVGDASSNKTFINCSRFQNQVNGMHNSSGSGSRTPAGDDWVLDCEICHKRGINQDDGTPILCCGICSKWQHISCHDRADFYAGRPKRNWNVEEFVCQQCRSKHSRNLVVGTQPYQFDQIGSQFIRQPPNAVTATIQMPTQTEFSGLKFPNNCGEQQNHASAINGNPHRKTDTPHVRPSATPTVILQAQRHQVHDSLIFSHYQPYLHGFSQTQHPHTLSFPTSSQYPDTRPNGQSSSFQNVGAYTQTTIKGWNTSPLNIHNYSSLDNGVEVSAGSSAYAPDEDHCLPEPPEDQHQWQPPQLDSALSDHPSRELSSFLHQPRTGTTHFQPPL